MNDLLELRNITKTYPGVTALDDVSVSFRKGEVHAIVGENSARNLLTALTSTRYPG
jgi:ABC-type uncharacterized transport system ATPase subunit